MSPKKGEQIYYFERKATNGWMRWVNEVSHPPRGEWADKLTNEVDKMGLGPGGKVRKLGKK